MAFVGRSQDSYQFHQRPGAKTQADISSGTAKDRPFDGNRSIYEMYFADEADVNRVLTDMPHCRTTRWNPYGVDINCRGQQ